jgi:vacuolar-type H+-ATPase subunit E/Vma4
VNASAPERELLTPSLLARAEETARPFANVRLALSEDPPLDGQGVVLSDAAGRLAYNNQVATRFLRARTAIRKTIQAELFGGEA